MRGITAWALIGMLSVFVLATGCEDKSQEIEQAPPQAPMDPFPESAVPPPEPQPAPMASATPPPPPVDTTADHSAAQSASKSRATQQPKESYSSNTKKAARTYVVKKGDTLQKISQRFYGTTKNWQKICTANRKVLKNCDDLTPGTKLVIP